MTIYKLFLLVTLISINIGISNASSVPSSLINPFHTINRDRLTPISRKLERSWLGNPYHSPLAIRGGSDASDSEFSDSDFDFDDDDLFGLDDGGDLETMEDDFGEDSTLDQIIESWKKTPPFTKMYLSASIAATGLGYLTNKNQFPEYFKMEWKAALLKGQFWRPFTAFLNFGPMGIGYLMTGHFVWTYMSTLERLNYDAPYDFWVMIIFGCASMVVGYSVLKVPPTYLGHNLSTFLVYVWSRYHEGIEVNLMELFNTRAELLPWFFVAQTALLEGEFPILDILGIVFGHIYHHFKTTNILVTPKALIQWYKGDSKYSKMIREQ